MYHRDPSPRDPRHRHRRRRGRLRRGPRGPALQPAQPRPASAVIVRAACVEDVQADRALRRSHRPEGQAARQRPQLVGHRAAGRHRARPRGARPDRDRRRGAASPRSEPAAKNGVLAAALTATGSPSRSGTATRSRSAATCSAAASAGTRGAWGLACHNVEAVEVVMADGSADPGERVRAPGHLLGGARRRAGVLRRRRPLPAPAARPAEGDRTSLCSYPIERVAEVEAWVTAAMATAPADRRVRDADAERAAVRAGGPARSSSASRRSSPTARRRRGRCSGGSRRWRRRARWRSRRCCR